MTDSTTHSQGTEQDFRHYVPAHSDFLIHWTGKDIDWKYERQWITESSSITDGRVTEAYLKRLKSILKFGLWMTTDPGEDKFTPDHPSVTRPNPARTCFTELKLSTVRSHAARYGRLGIGFKRLFIVERFGGPMLYYHPGAKGHWFFPPYLGGGRNEYAQDDFFACFLKPMVEGPGSPTMVYTYYDESEWRIIYSNEIADKLERSYPEAKAKFKAMIEIDATEFRKTLEEGSTTEPDFLIPVRDKWLAMIIYPSLTVKVEAEADEEIRRLLREAKPDELPAKRPDRSSLARWERYSRPIEIDLDACRNF